MTKNPPRLRIVSPDGLGMTTRIYARCAEESLDITGLLGVEEVTLTMRAAMPVQAVARLAIVAVDASPRFIRYEGKHPLSNAYLPIARIEWADGSSVRFEEDGMPVIVKSGAESSDALTRAAIAVVDEARLAMGEVPLEGSIAALARLVDPFRSRE